MSDADRQSDGDDALSSIRELIAEGAERSAAPTERLVLTPALRVPDREAEAAPAPRETFERRIAKLEAVVAGHDGTRDSAATDASATRDIASGEAEAMPADDTTDEAGQADAPSADEAADDGSADSAAGADPEHDGTDDPDPAENVEEAALREVVRALIREELHGELGERVTRSVRKLVRQEINRALASRELE